MDLRLSSRLQDGIPIVEVGGEVDVFTAPRLRDALNAQIAEGHRLLVLDLTDVTFMDSTGLGVVIGRLKALRPHGGDVVLVVTSDRLMRNFQITGLDKVLRIVDTADQAVQALGDEVPAS